MIGRLRGTVADKQPPALLLDVAGVGYELEASMATFARLPALGAEVTLYTHLQVREDAHTLYGFASLEERGLFRSLIKISGVGAKLALLILSGMSVEHFTRCVEFGDSAALTKLPGIGKKTAERLVMEMRDRVTGIAAAGPTTGPAEAGRARPVSALDDAISALIALGYKPQEAARMANAAAKASPDSDSETLIRQALAASVRG